MANMATEIHGIEYQHNIPPFSKGGSGGFDTSEHFSEFA